jgi:hypothetical protein
MNRLPQALAGLNRSKFGGKQASSSALLGKLVGAVNGLCKLGAGMHDSCAGRRPGHQGPQRPTFNPI